MSWLNQKCRWRGDPSENIKESAFEIFKLKKTDPNVLPRLRYRVTVFDRTRTRLYGSAVALSGYLRSEHASAGFRQLRPQGKHPRASICIDLWFKVRHTVFKCPYNQAKSPAIYDMQSETYIPNSIDIIMLALHPHAFKTKSGEPWQPGQSYSEAAWLRQKINIFNSSNAHICLWWVGYSWICLVLSYYAVLQFSASFTLKFLSTRVRAELRKLLQ